MDRFNILDHWTQWGFVPGCQVFGSRVCGDGYGFEDFGVSWAGSGFCGVTYLVLGGIWLGGEEIEGIDGVGLYCMVECTGLLGGEGQGRACD